MEHTKHLWRVGLLILVGLAAAVFGRHFLVPDSFNMPGYGYYRADSLAELMAMPVHHGEAGACAGCHEEEQEQHDEGAHKTVACESCHAPLAVHVRTGAGGELVHDPDDEGRKMPSNKSQDLCETCHLRLRARPENFPQIEPGPHLLAVEAIEEGEPVPRDTCFVCPSPHSPKID